MQNGLPAAYKPVATGNLNYTDYQDTPGVNDDLLKLFPADEWECSSDPTAFRPICYPAGAVTSCNGPANTPFQCWAPFTYSDYFGQSIANPGQNDGLNVIRMQTDRFVFPEFNTTLPHQANAPVPGKSALYGSIESSARAFFARDGRHGSAVASPNAFGIMGTADYSISLLRNPSTVAWIENYFGNSPPNGLAVEQILGLFWLMGGPGSALSKQAPMYLGCGGGYEDPTRCWFLKASEFALGNGVGGDFFNPNWQGISGTVSNSIPAADPSAPVDPILSRFVAGCAGEMVSAGRFSDAQAFLADALPAIAGSADPSANRAFTILANLRTARKDSAVRAVPFLSAATLEQAVELELGAMASLEGNLTSLADRSTTAAAALTLLAASNATIQAAVDSASTELQGDIKNVQLLQVAFDTMNSTYADRYADVSVKQQAFEDGVKKAETAEIAEIVVEFVLDVASCIATEGASAATIMDTVEKAGGTAAKVFANLEKFAATLAQIGAMIYNVDSLVNQIIPIVNQIESLPSAPDITVPPAAIDIASGGNTTIASLSTAMLSFQDLRDQATVYLGPAITQNIDGASDYALSLSALANAGIDLVSLQTQLVTAQLKMLQSAIKLQAAQAAQSSIGNLVTAAQSSQAALVDAAVAVQLDLLDRKMLALDLLYQVGAAYAFARTAPGSQPSAMPDPSSPVGAFTSAVRSAIQALDNQISISQPVCNASWIEEDPYLIGNLSTTGIGYLDLRDPTKPALANFFSGLDDVHMLQINLKPYGIKFNGTDIPGLTPALQLDIDPTGEYRNTFHAANAQRYVESFLATPWSFAMVAEPTNGWQVTTPGSLTTDASAKYYVPSVYGKYRVSGDPDMTASWDWSGVWGLQVEIWGYATKPGNNAAATGGAAKLAACSSLSRAVLAAVTGN
ncbi:hypothetical protein DFJ74DRAFT_261079 [Hyaloraphidium curvatum]|nr:hypothetical protein DFJ74DRAFT_261079 [Hyaloraphidium curvatum]